MAQEAVNTVIQALQRGFEQVQQIHNAQQQKEEFQQEQALREKEQADRESQFQAQQNANQKLFELQKSQVEHQQAQQELADTQAFQQSGITPPGAQVIPGLQPTAAQPLVLSGLEQNKVIFPSGTTYSVPPLSESPAFKAQALQASAQEQSRIRESQATQAAEAARNILTQQEETKRFLAQINLQKQYDEERDKRDIAGRQSVAAMEAAGRIREAMINATGGLSETFGGNIFGAPKGQGQGGVGITTGQGGQPQFNLPGALGVTINQSLNNIYKGTDSLERQEKVNPKLKQVISSAAAQFGVNSLTDSDVKDLGDLQTISREAVKPLQQMHLLRANYPNEINIPGTKAFKDYSTASDQFKAAVAKISTSLSGSKRINTTEIKNYLDGLTPNRVPVISGARQENDKFNNFITDYLWGGAKDIIKGLPESQQNAILSTYGFTKLPSTIINTPKITVIDRATGQKGTISPQFFDSNKYSFPAQ